MCFNSIVDGVVQKAPLKDKNKELNVLKARIAQLQESHVKFRSQIQSLDSVKDLTVALQNQLSIMQQENKQLGDENKELAQLNIRADELLKDKENSEENQTNILRDVQLDFATLRGRYEETTKAHRELEKLASNEQALRLATEARLESSEETISAVREENRTLRQQLDTAAIRLNQCDQELLHASEQLADLNREVSVVQENKSELAAKESELGLIKGDIARLLRLFEHAPATREFMAHWQDSEEGMDFVGIDRDVSAVAVETGVSRSQNNNILDDSGVIGVGASAVNTSVSVMNDTNRSVRRVNQSRSNIVTNDSTILNSFDLSPAEFAHLKRIHGGDPFPLTRDLAEEAEYWVPSEAARLGLQFLSSKIPHASPKVIMDFLRSMNKIWLRRERRKIKRVKQVLSQEIEDLKRQLSQSKPYKGVIAERQIRRLRSQVKGERRKHLVGRPRGSLDDMDYGGLRGQRFESGDQDDTKSLPAGGAGGRRLCKIVNRAKHTGAASVDVVSTEKLLEASLYSLESMGRQINVTAANSTHGASSMLDESSGIMSPSAAMSTHQSFASPTAAASAGGSYPNESYLRGAMWLGRNFTILSEELAEEMDTFRTKFMGEVSSASQDTDLRRCCHRLTLLANSGITQAHSMTHKSRQKVREILQGASSLKPGDSHGFKALLRTLPIESALAQGGSNL